MIYLIHNEIYRASLKTRLIKEKTDMCGSCKESFRRRAVALQGRLTKQMTCIAVFSQKGFLEMPYSFILAQSAVLKFNKTRAAEISSFLL